jgi:hypothetical protein
MMDVKLYRMNIDVSDRRLQAVLDLLIDRRCTKPFVVAALQEFIGSYKGQNFFEILTAKDFPFEKKRRAGRIGGKSSVDPEVKGHVHTPSVKHSPSYPVKGEESGKDSSLLPPKGGKRSGQSSDLGDSLLDGLLSRTTPKISP